MDMTYRQPKRCACGNLRREKEGLIKTLLELRDRLTMGQDNSGNSEINQNEIELINKAIQKARGI